MEIATKTVDQYIENFSTETQERLVEIRKVIKEVAPEAIESFAYGLAAYKIYGKPLVYFGGFAHHIGFYATPTGHAAFAQELAHFKQGKGSVQFPHTDDLPLALIARIVRYRVEENSAKITPRSKKN